MTWREEWAELMIGHRIQMANFSNWADRLKARVVLLVTEPVRKLRGASGK
jgi:hypothetical protein